MLWGLICKCSIVDCSVTDDMKADLTDFKQHHDCFHETQTDIHGSLLLLNTQICLWENLCLSSVFLEQRH